MTQLLAIWLMSMAVPALAGVIVAAWAMRWMEGHENCNI